MSHQISKGDEHIPGKEGEYIMGSSISGGSSQLLDGGCNTYQLQQRATGVLKNPFAIWNTVLRPRANVPMWEPSRVLYGDKAGNYVPPLWLELRSAECHACMPSQWVLSHPYGLNPLESYSVITQAGWDLKCDSRTFAVVCFVLFLLYMHLKLFAIWQWKCITFLLFTGPTIYLSPIATRNRGIWGCLLFWEMA